MMADSVVSLTIGFAEGTGLFWIAGMRTVSAFCLSLLEDRAIR
jgi:hypothetical protein